MNEVLRQLHERKSVRVYEDRPVEADVKQAVLDAAIQAPSAGNMALYTILDITDPELKQKLSVSCDNQPFIATASMVLVFCADYKRWYDTFRQHIDPVRKPEEGDLFLAQADAFIAAQNTVVAAESLGIGSCYIGDIMENCEEQRALLKLPEYVFPAAMLVFGYPTEQQKERQKPRRANTSHIVHQNSYREMSSDELRDLFSIRTDKKDYEEYMKAFCTRKYNSEFSREMSRSVGEYLKQFENQ